MRLFGRSHTYNRPSRAGARNAGLPNCFDCRRRACTPRSCHRSAPRRTRPSAACTRRCRIEHDHAPVAVAVGDEDFVGGASTRWPRAARVRLAVAALGLAGLADLQQEFAVARELQDVTVRRVVAGNPDVALPVHVDAVFVLRPIVALARPAPALHVIAVGSNSITAGAATQQRSRRRLLLGALVVVEHRVADAAAPTRDRGYRPSRSRPAPRSSCL